MTKVRQTQNELEKQHGTIQRNQGAIASNLPGCFTYILLLGIAAASIGSCHYSKKSYEALERLNPPAAEAQYETGVEQQNNYTE